jgi:hypothetical protein
MVNQRNNLLRFIFLIYLDLCKILTEHESGLYEDKAELIKNQNDINARWRNCFTLE